MQTLGPECPLCIDQMVVLIVDDESVICDLVKAVLESDGYHILTATNGQDALMISRTFPGKIDLLLTDITMPKMSGLELRERIGVERPGTKVLLMSGQCDLPASVLVLRKPFGTSDLRQSVRTVLLGSVEVSGYEDAAITLCS